MTQPEPRIGRLRWRSRRGMQELDKLLERYFDSPLLATDEESIASLEYLLDCEDTDLLDWLLGRTEPPDPQIKRLIELIRKA